MADQINVNSGGSRGSGMGGVLAAILIIVLAARALISRKEGPNR